MGDAGEKISAGATGAVMGLWAGGAAPEVEVAEPVSAPGRVDIDAMASHWSRRSLSSGR